MSIHQTLRKSRRSLCLSAAALMVLSFGAPMGHAELAGPAPASAFGRLPAVYDAAISPDGKQIAMFINVKGTYGIRIVGVNEPKGAKLRMIMLGEGVKPEWINWANNDQVLASLWQSETFNKTPFTMGYLYKIDAATAKGDILVNPNKGLFRQYNNVVVDFLKDDPDHILMAYSNANVLAPDIRKVSLRDGSAERIRVGRETIQQWYTDRRGEPRIGQGLNDDRNTETWTLLIRGANDDKWESYTAYPGLEGDTDIVGFTADPDEMIIRSRNGKDTVGLYIYDLGEKRLTRTLFHDDVFDASGVVLSGDGSEVIGARLVTDEAETRLFGDIDTAIARYRRKNPGVQVDFIDQSEDKNFYLARVSTPYWGGALQLIDSRDDTVITLGKYHPELDDYDLGAVAPLKYPARDGFKVPAYVTLPASVTDPSQLKNLPFIVLPHGGPYARSSKRFDTFAQFFANQGYGVLQMNFRGSSGYGEKFEDSGRKNWELMLQDVEDGGRWLVEKGYADPKRLCVAGWSFGGYAALMEAIESPDLYKCAISMAGVTDIPDLVDDAKKYRFGRLTAKNSILSGFADRESMIQNSPARRASALQVPLFIAHGTLDQRVHFDQYKRMKSALGKSSAKVTYMEFEGEDHFLSSEKNRVRFYEGLEKFLVQTNGKSEFAR